MIYIVIIDLNDVIYVTFTQIHKYRFTLYKYRDWKNPFHTSIIHANELYVPTIGEINDPFDFKIPPKVTLVKISSA